MALSHSQHEHRKKTVLFVDEVQRFTKAQQDLFLPYIEAGLISCIVSLHVAYALCHWRLSSHA